MTPTILALRRLGFAWTLAAVVALYTRWLCDALPPLRTESAWLVVVPATGIAAAVLAAMHGAVVRATTHAGRLSLLGVATAISITLYTSYLLMLLLPGAENLLGLSVLVVGAQLLYGLPLFLAVAVVAKLTSRWLVARPVTAWI